jgi:hypothetical protein
MKGDKLLAVCDESTLSIINIEKSTVEKHTMDNKNLTKLFKLPLPNENGTQIFAGSTSNGLLKIWTEVL